MTQITKPVVCEKATDEVLQGLAKLVTDVKAALKLGGTVPEAIAIAGAVLNDIVPQIANIQVVPADWSEDHIAFEKTIALGLVEIQKAIVS